MDDILRWVSDWKLITQIYNRADISRTTTMIMLVIQGYLLPFTSAVLVDGLYASGVILFFFLFCVFLSFSLVSLVLLWFYEGKKIFNLYKYHKESLWEIIPKHPTLFVSLFFFPPLSDYVLSFTFLLLLLQFK